MPISLTEKCGRKLLTKRTQEKKIGKENEIITYYIYDVNGDLVEDQYIGMEDVKSGYFLLL